MQGKITSTAPPPPSFHRGVVKLYNNPNLAPLSENITHPFFMSEQYDISFENAQGEMVDAIESKNRFATLSKNIATICSKWLISGNGEGQ